MEDLATGAIEACQRGDVQSFAAVVAHYERPLFSFVYRLSSGLNAGIDAEDILQEVFLKAYRQIDTFNVRRGGRFTNWIYAIARNHCLSLLRQKKNVARAGELTSALIDSLADAHSPTPRESACRQELSAQIAGAVAQLPEPFQSAFILRHYEDMPFEDIAAIMETSVGTAKSRVARARGRLAERLKNLRDNSPGIAAGNKR